MLRAAAALAFLSNACTSQANQSQFDISPSARLYIAGDSTAADYPNERAPQIGWGQTLQYFFADPARIHNRAVNGRSTKSYINEGHWDSLLEEVKAGDVVLISFGHNAPATMR